MLISTQGSLYANKLVEKGGDYPVDWAKFNDNIYSVWLVMLNVDFDFDSLVATDRLMAQVCRIFF